MHDKPLAIPGNIDITGGPSRQYNTRKSPPQINITISADIPEFILKGLTVGRKKKMASGMHKVAILVLEIP